MDMYVITEHGWYQNGEFLCAIIAYAESHPDDAALIMKNDTALPTLRLLMLAGF